MNTNDARDVVNIIRRLRASEIPVGPACNLVEAIASAAVLVANTDPDAVAVVDNALISAGVVGETIRSIERVHVLEAVALGHPDVAVAHARAAAVEVAQVRGQNINWPVVM